VRLTQARRVDDDVLARTSRGATWRPGGHRVTSAATEQLQRALLPHQLRTGHWFHSLMVAKLRAHDAKHPRQTRTLATEPASDAERIIRKTALQSALLGTGVAAVTTAGGVATAETQGMAGLLAVPAAAASMVGDLALRAWITTGMSCDVAALFGVRFDPDHPSDLARLYAVALEAVSSPEKTDARGHELLEHLVPAHSEEIGTSIGSMLGSETLARNVFPVIGLLTSGVSSYYLTRHLGEVSMRYARGRRALTDAFEDVEKFAPDARDLLIVGAWFVFTVDGMLNAHEAAILSHFVHRRPAKVRRSLLNRMRDDEAGWLERIERLPQEAKQPFMRALETAAALDTKLPRSEIDLLTAAARHLGTVTSPDAVESLATRFREIGLRAPAPAEGH
jgi:hypothetical protein